MKVTTLTISPQGQITIPKQWRTLLGLQKGAKAIAWLEKKLKNKALVLTPQPESWIDAVAGTGKDLWGDSAKYIKKERAQWE